MMRRSGSPAPASRYHISRSPTRIFGICPPRDRPASDAARDVYNAPTLRPDDARGVAAEAAGRGGVRMVKRRSRSSIAVLAGLVALGGAVPGLAADKTLKIGVLGPLSGGAASYGVELVRGAEIRTDEINHAGGLKVGIDTYKIELISYDHKAGAADAATAANKLVFQDKVQYIIGNAVGATCNAVQTVTEPQKVVFAFVCWGTKNLGPDKPYSFRSMLSQCEAAEPFYRWVKDKRPKIKKVAVISPNDTSGLDTNTAVVKAAKALRFDVIADEYYERGTKDFYPLLTKIIAKQPDMIDVAAAPPGQAGPPPHKTP